MICSGHKLRARWLRWNPGNASSVRRRAAGKSRVILSMFLIYWHGLDASDDKINAERCNNVLKRMTANIERVINGTIKMLKRLRYKVGSKQSPYEVPSRYL